MFFSLKWAVTLDKCKNGNKPLKYVESCKLKYLLPPADRTALAEKTFSSLWKRPWSCHYPKFENEIKGKLLFCTRDLSFSRATEFRREYKATTMIEVLVALKDSQLLHRSRKINYTLESLKKGFDLPRNHQNAAHFNVLENFIISF